MKKWLALLLALVMVLSLAACGGKGDKEKDRGEDIKPKPGPEVTVEAFCEAMKAFDFQEMNRHLQKKADIRDSLEGETAEFAEKYVQILRGWAGEMTWELGESAENGFPVTFRYTDASAVFQKVVDEFLSKMILYVLKGMTREEMKEELGKILEETVKTTPTGTAQETVTFQMVETADGWLIREMPEKAANVLFSNLLSQFNNLDIG